MIIKEIYKLAINLGMKADLRDNKLIKKRLKKLKESYKDLKPFEKEVFDKERLNNPYSDTRMLCGNENKKVKRILAGIDIDTSELLLAKKISQSRPIDLVLSHHPRGIALARLDDVMALQIDLLEDLGIPVNIAEKLLKLRMAEVARSISAENHYQEVDAAELLNLNMMCVHTPADNMVTRFIKNKIDKADIDTVGDIMNILKSIPEYKEAAKKGAGPAIFTGSKDSRAGKIALTEVTGGTSGHKDVYEKLALAGIGTIIGMHMSEEYKKEAEKNHINVIIAGHIASDSLGMNIFLDELEKKGIEVIPCSGLIRVSRN